MMVDLHDDKVSLSLCYLFIYLLSTKIQEDYIPFAACLRDQAAICRCTWAENGRRVCSPLHHNLLFIKEIPPPSARPPSAPFLFSSGGPNSDRAP